MSPITGDTASLKKRGILYWTGVKIMQILKFEVGKEFPVPGYGLGDE